MRLLALLSLLVFSLTAQTFNARLTGTVRDSSRLVVPGARITAVQSSTAARKSAATDSSGIYSIPLLLPGVYEVTIEAQGFQTQIKKDIRLEVNQAATVDFDLTVAQVATAVEVTAELPLLQSETSGVGSTVENRLLLQFPLQQRDVMGVLRALPGVITGSNVGDARGNRNVFNSNFSVGGGRANMNEVLLDGAPNTIGDFNGVVAVPPQDAVQELRIETNSYSAEFGRSGGGAVNIVTKAGTNDLHGTAYYYHQNTEFNANSFTNNRNRLPRPILRRHQYGVTAGGPIIKNKTFFFGNFEGRRERDPIQGLYSVPAELERGGNFSQTYAIIGGNPQLIQIYDPATSQLVNGQVTRQVFPGNIVPANRHNTISRRVLQDMPLGNQAGDPITNRRNYFYQDKQEFTRDLWGVRADHYFNERHRIFGRYNWQKNLQFNPGVIVGFADRTSVLDHMQNSGLDDTYQLTPTLSNNLRASYARFRANQYPIATLGFDPTTLGLPSYVRDSSNVLFYPNFSFGFVDMGGRAFNNQPRDTWSIQEQMVWTRGRHNLRGGGEWRIYRFYPFQVFNPVGAYTFGSNFTQNNHFGATNPTQGFGLASFLLGTGNFSYERVEPLTAAAQYWAGYVQDDYKISSRLTLNLGLRWEIETGITERGDRLTYFDPNFKTPLAGDVRGAMLFTGDGNPRSLREPNRTNFGPRIGLAWRAARNTSVRAGYGIFFLPQGLEPTLSTTPFNFTVNADVVTTSGLPRTTLSNPFPDGIPINAPRRNDGSYNLGINSNLVAREQPQPYQQQWNFAVGQQFGRSTVLDVTYFGSRGVHLPIPSLELNQMHPEYLARGGTWLNQRVPNPYFGQIRTGLLSLATIPQMQLVKPYSQFAAQSTANAYGGSLNWFRAPVGDSSYHAVTTKIERRYSAGLSLSAHYTWSKLIDTGGGGNGAAFLDPSALRDIYNIRLERALSSWDVAHRLIVTYAYDLPFGKGKTFMKSANRLMDGLVGGWTIFGFHTFESGRPVVVGGPDLSRLAGAAPSRVSVVWDAKAALPGDVSRANARDFSPVCNCTKPWFNPAAFSTTPEFQIPNGPRTLPDVRQDYTRNWDVSLDKKIAITERVAFTLQGRFFNILNQVYFAGPSVTAVNAANFGSTTAVNSAPRRIEVGGRIVF